MRDRLAICSYLSGNYLNWEFSLINFFLSHSGCSFAAGGERCSQSTSKDREMAASHYGNPPD